MNKKSLLLVLCLGAFYTPVAKSDTRSGGIYTILLIAGTYGLSFMAWHNTTKIREASEQTETDMKCIKTMLKETQNTLEEMCAAYKNEPSTKQKGN